MRVARVLCARRVVHMFSRAVFGGREAKPRVAAETRKESSKRDNDARGDARHARVVHGATESATTDRVSLFA